MPPRSRNVGTQGRWRAIALSLFVHGLIVAAAVLGWFTWKHEPPPPDTLAIEATVVDERALKGIAAKPTPAPPEPPKAEPEPEPAPVEEQGPPAPDPEELKRKEDERLAQEKAEQEKQEQLEREKQQEQEKAQEQKRLDAEKKEQERLDAEKEAQKEADKQAAAKAAAQKAAAERAAAEKRAAEKKKAEDAAAAKKAAEEKARRASEEELRRSLEAEERGNAARNSAAASQWYSAIVARIERAWIKPPSAVAGVSCTVLVSQVPGGEVTSVRVSTCSVNDAALRESVEAAVFRASPLPTPPPGVPFERNLELTFAPQ